MKKDFQVPRRISISTYSLGFALVALIPVIIIAILAVNEADSIQKKANEESMNYAREILDDTINRILHDIRVTAEDLATWDETRAQLVDSTYYKYWKDSRVKVYHRVQSLNAEVDLFTARGNALDTSSIVTPPIRREALDKPVFWQNKGKVYLLYQHPIEIAILGEAEVQLIGYISIKSDINAVLANYPTFLHTDISSIQWKLQEAGFVNAKNAIKTANLPNHSSPAIDAFADLTRNIVIKYAIYVLALFCIIAYLWISLFSRPLKRLADHIKALYDGRSDNIPDELKGVARVKELEQVRIAINDYIDKFLHATNSLMEKNEELTRLTYRDTLTGMFNRRAFEQHLTNSLLNARSEGTQHILCYLDLDQFKIVNDTCGHLAGDALLKQIAFRLQKEIREADMLARLGGDEFGVILEGCDLGKARQIADLLRSSVKRFRFAWDNRLFEVGVSIGVVPITENSPGADELLRAADSACYVAKDLGRNRVHVYQANDKEVARRIGEMQWVSRINQALEEKHFELFYQPIIPTRNVNVVSHYEVLLRMRDETEKLILPMAFIPAAERYQLMPKIDRWVVAETIKALAEGRLTHGKSQPLVAINLSGQSLGDEGFLEYTLMLIKREKIRPELLCFEITETAAITNLSAANRFISTFADIGCQFSLDDFGSGLSSFSYLKTLSVNYLKIDGHFIRHIFEEPINRTIIESIHHIGRNLGLKTVAEYVENKQILDELALIGIDYVQGYAVAKPSILPELQELAVTAG